MVLLNVLCMCTSAHTCTPTITGGFWTGNPDLAATSTYEGMQQRVSAGYAAYKDFLVKRGNNAVVAPCGGAFSIVNSDNKAGKAAVPFKELYYGIDANPDQRHPSKKGHYLAALTLANTITQSCLQGWLYCFGGFVSTLVDGNNQHTKNTNRTTILCARVAAIR